MCTSTNRRVTIVLMDPAAAKEITKMLWSVGDYTEVAKLTLPPAIDLVDAVGITDRQTVLDVATGSGNVAVLAAQRGAASARAI